MLLSIQEGWSALVWASIYGRRYIVDLLLKAGADRKIKDKVTFGFPYFNNENCLAKLA
jgi:ankyrin repeat protein